MTPKRVGLAALFAYIALPGCRHGERGAPKPAPVATTTPVPQTRAEDAGVLIRFVAKDVHSHCREDTCNDAPLVSVRRDNEKTPLALSAGRCAVLCSDCVLRACPESSCVSKGIPLTGAELSWDGTYFEPGVCRSGTPCVTARKAPPGKYVAELCAPLGNRSNDSIGVPVCVESGTPTCTSVPFDWPRGGTVAATF